MSPEPTSTGTDRHPPRPWWARYTDADLIALAKAYPFTAQAYSYVFAGGHALELVDFADDPLRTGRVRGTDGRIRSVAHELAALGIDQTPPMNRRTPVLAYGSNGAPSQLARKYGDVPGAVIPVLQAAVRDVDVVYSAHITRYGAIPATLAESHGTILRTSITWLSDHELEVMHESEMGSGGAVPGNYTFGRFERLSVVSRGLSENRKMSAYVSRFGALGLHEAPIALAQVTAEHRAFAEYSKIAMLGAVRNLLAVEYEVDEFILSAIREEAARHRWTRQLHESAHPISLPGFSDPGDRVG